MFALITILIGILLIMIGATFLIRAIKLINLSWRNRWGGCTSKHLSKTITQKNTTNDNNYNSKNNIDGYT